MGMAERRLTRPIVRVLILVCFLLPPGLAQADEPTISIMLGVNHRSFTRGELLMRPDATTFEVSRDVTYRMPVSYCAVRVASGKGMLI
jgi:hypothetical protein